VLVPANPSLEAVLADVKQPEDLQRKQCCGCQKYALEIKLCTACKQARYCSKECQREHWPAHKEECKKNRPQQQGAGQ
jgi:hypothetical protein